MNELEKEIEEYAVEYAKALNLRIEKLAGPVGWPDRTIFGLPMRGNMAFVEFKTRNGKVARAQQFWLNYLAGSGHKTAIIRSKEQAKQFIDHLVEGDEE